MRELDVDVVDEPGTAPPPERVRAAVEEALAVAQAPLEGHLAVQFVEETEMRGVNRAHRARDEATDVLSFPVDGSELVQGPREFGDVIVCMKLCEHALEAVVHGTLHLVGFDHETDSGEMLELQERIVARLEAP